jgi:hypothetical protein
VPSPNVKGVGGVAGKALLTSLQVLSGDNSNVPVREAPGMAALVALSLA